MNIALKNLSFFFLISFLTSCTGNSAEHINPEAELIRHIDWEETHIDKGIILKKANTELFDSRQAIFYVEIGTSVARLDYFVGMPEDLQTTSAQALENDALIAINGSYFHMQQGYSRHLVIIEDSVVARTEAHEFDTRATGIFSVEDNGVDIEEWNSEKEQMAAHGASFALVCGPIVLDDNQEMEMWDNNFVHARHPRSFIGFCNSKLLMGVVDGRDPDRAEGMNLHELKTFARALGCTDLLNLDGGGSSTLYIRGYSNKGIVNIPSDGQERPVKSIIYVKGSSH